MDIPKREPEELFYLYEREPELRDVIVEGPSDASIFRWLLSSEKNITEIGVYEIATININDGKLIDRGRNANNRERVILLAELYEKCCTNPRQLSCVVDKDFSTFLKDFVRLPSLFYTDFACMEMYCFDDVILNKLYNIYCNKFDWPCEDILNSLALVLQRFFLIRLVNQHLKWGMDSLEKMVCLDLKHWEITFDEDNYIQRLLNKNNRLGQEETFRAALREFDEQLQKEKEVRNKIQGHDFVNLL